MPKYFRLLFLVFVSAWQGSAQIITTLHPQTVQEFDQYAQKVEQELSQRWHGQRPFLSIDDDPADRAKVLAGDLLIRPGNPDNPVSISDGLVHDWLGAVFFPNTSLAKVMAVLQDFNQHSKIYPNILRSRLISHTGNDFTGYWRLEKRQGLIVVDLDVEEQAHWQQITPDKWICRAYAKNIREVEDPGTPRETLLPEGRGQGFLWRLYAYWSLEATNGGVLGECRTLSLSRGIPAMFAFAVRPFVESLPRESLANTMRDTLAAVSK